MYGSEKNTTGKGRNTALMNSLILEGAFRRTQQDAWAYPRRANAEEI